MAKRVALKDSVKVDTTDLSNFSRTVTFSSEHDRIDVSGFNATGAQEFLAGQTTQSVSVEFYNGYGTGEPHTVLYPIHKNRTIVPFAWRPDQTAVVSATNPELRGNVQLLTYNPSATRGDAETWTAEFTTADPAGLQYFTT